jgi:hypothetical protein
MFEGWCTDDYTYIKNEADAKKWVTQAGFRDLQHAFDEGYIFWTSWVDEPEEEWDEVPQQLLLSGFVEMTDRLLETIEEHDVMPEIVETYRAIFNEYKSHMFQP